MIKIKNHHTFYIGMLIVYMYGQCRKDLQEINLGGSNILLN